MAKVAVLDMGQFAVKNGVVEVNINDEISEQIASKAIQKSGDIVTGQILVPAPLTPESVANKDYVDSKISGGVEVDVVTRSYTISASATYTFAVESSRRSQLEILQFDAREDAISNVLDVLDNNDAAHFETSGDEVLFISAGATLDNTITLTGTGSVDLSALSAYANWRMIK